MPAPKLLLLFIVLTCSVQAQITPEFPDGIYMTATQLRNKTPEFKSRLLVEKRGEGDVAFNGGNDYRLEPLNDSLSKKTVKNEVYAYVTNDSIFLNGKVISSNKWYSLSLTRGNFLVFRGGIPPGEMATYGALGGGLLVASLSTIRYLYVLSQRTGNVRKLDADYIAARLEENPPLLEQFNLEKNKKSEEVLLRYINLLNGFIDPLSHPPVDSSLISTKRKRK